MREAHAHKLIALLRLVVAPPLPLAGLNYGLKGQGQTPLAPKKQPKRGTNKVQGKTELE